MNHEHLISLRSSIVSFIQCRQLPLTRAWMNTSFTSRGSLLTSIEDTGGIRMDLEVETTRGNPDASSFLFTAAGKHLSDCSEHELQEEADRLAKQLCEIEKELKDLLVRIEVCYKYAVSKSQ